MLPFPISWVVGFILWGFQVAVVAHLLTVLLQLDPKNALVRLIRAPAEPLLRLVRPLAKKIPVPVDLTHAVAFFGLMALKAILT